MGNIGPGELIIIALIALLLFGAGRIADIGKGLGQGIKNFKQGLKEGEGDAADDAEDAKAASKPAKGSEPKKKRVVVEDSEDSESDEKAKEKA